MAAVDFTRAELTDWFRARVVARQGWATPLVMPNPQTIRDLYRMMEVAESDEDVRRRTQTFPSCGSTSNLVSVCT